MTGQTLRPVAAGASVSAAGLPVRNQRPRTV